MPDVAANGVSELQPQELARILASVLLMCATLSACGGSSSQNTAMPPTAYTAFAPLALT
jgi:hypothetical protein